ncbi:hypothetical protein ID866_7942 [Astraeus odoratus]|nr:hypothetical protein ID866_7942 [Astraeus odoratus]
MSDLYESESKRVEEINKVFQDYNVHFTVTEVEKTGCAVDADISVNGHRYVIAEYKNETGSTAADPYFQGIGYYLESTRETALKFPRSPLPCFLLAIFGPYIVFAGAAWNLRPTVQILSTPVAFHSHSTVARHMAAFRKAARTLKQYYETVEATPLPTLGPVPRQVFPYPTNYKSLVDGTEKQFDYLMAPDEDKLVFYGVEDEGDDICIKFTQAYSREAHEYLASLGCAPALRGLEELDGVWYMVIMDMLSGFELLSYWPARLSSRVFEVMLEKLKEFHDAGFVHGDIRDANIMVSRTDEMRFMFIDFDWAGRVDEVRYPLNVNYTDIVRPAGARGGRNILAEHDLFMLEDIARSKSQPHN